MPLTRRSLLRAAALSAAMLGAGGGSAGALARVAAARGPAGASDVLQLAVAYPSTAAHRLALQRFDDTHAIVDGGVELLLWPGDVARLEAAGVPFRITVPDVLARDHAAAATDDVSAVDLDALAASVPGGVTDYRNLDQMYAEFDALAAAAAAIPGLTVTIITLPVRSFEGRIIKAIEIYRGNGFDGRGVAYIDGIHHAREWPAAEYPMIFAHHLVENSTDARVKAMLESVRVRICPVINVDGFVYSRSWANTILDSSILGIVAGGQGAYVRKTQRNNPAVTPGVDSDVFYGVDPNRNYAYLWGGMTGSLINGVDAPLYASTSPNPLDQTYHGTDAFTEPEVVNNRTFFLTNNVITYLSNHTSGRLVLRPWGHTTSPAPDDALLTEIGAGLADAMRGAGTSAPYENKIGLGLYPTLGTSNDWAYAATGTLGYVIEHSTAFHPPYSSTHGPGRVWPYAVEMFLRACEAAADPRAYSVLRGEVRDGAGDLVAATLKLTKSFSTPYASLDRHKGTGQYTALKSALDEQIELTLDTQGEYAWHVNPSTRPIAELGGQKEAYTLTATTADGRTATARVEVGRGETATIDLVVA